ncbi:MAG: nucleoside triphosphate pyrophosphohydrolase [Chromatiales bacterium]|nr:nucleoside triphosphate pyrophosphohydrolase [Chromatiales bacterium]
MPITELLDLMARLRNPEGGCPWDLEQNFASIAPYTIEEAYEVADAIERGDPDALREELGDLLFQVVFHARLAEEQGTFAFADVVAAIVTKMRRRHPHVFGDDVVADANEQTERWEAFKLAERGDASLFADIPVSLPALTRAAKLQKRARRLGLDWSSAAEVREKLDEELAELGAANDAAAEGRELGDILFTMVNMARWAGHDPEALLRAANMRFEQRARAVEAQCKAAPFDVDDPLAVDAAWRRAKARTE